MNAQFGEAYAHSVAQDYVLSGLGGRTINRALADGEDVKRVWRAVCDAFNVPDSLRLPASTGRAYPGRRSTPAGRKRYPGGGIGVSGVDRTVVRLQWGACGIPDDDGRDQRNP